MELVFFGSGPVAKRSLDLLSKEFRIEAIITKSSTKELMSSGLENIPVLCVESKNELDDLIKKSDFISKLAVLIDFGIIINKPVIEYFPLGIINSHFSQLPLLRGADPITFSILSGQTTTGVSLMLINQGMDTGMILAQKSLKIAKSDNSTTLTEKLIELSDNLLKKHLPLYAAGELSPRHQSHPKKATYTRKIVKKDGEINWNKPAEFLEREIRAYVNWPGSYTKIGAIELIIKKAHVIKAQGDPGKIEISKKELLVFCGKDALSLEIVQPAGKKEMPIQALLAGYRNRLTLA